MYSVAELCLLQPPLLFATVPFLFAEKLLAQFLRNGKLDCKNQHMQKNM